MIKLKNILLESPNKVYLSRTRSLNFEMSSAFTFGYSNDSNDFYLKPSSHFVHLNANPDDIYQGRYWEREGIISFWEYPTDRSIMMKLLRKINKNLKEIKIEIIRNTNDILQTKIFDIMEATQQIEDLMNGYVDYDEVDYYNEIISVDEYLRKYCK